MQDKAGLRGVEEEVEDIKAMLFMLRRILLEEEETTSDMAEELKDVAAVIQRLSFTTNFDNTNKLIRHEALKESEMDKTVEENEDLRRQIVFLEEQVKEKGHSIKLLEELLNKDKKATSCSRHSRKYFPVNSSTQTDRQSWKSEERSVGLRYEKRPILSSHLQSKYPLRSRSSFSLKDGKELNTQKSMTQYNNVISQQKSNQSGSSSFSISSTSSSSSNNPDCGVQEARSSKVLKENTLKSNNTNEETMAKARFFTPRICGLSPNGISRARAKEVRSRSSHSPAKRRRDSPRGKIYRDSSSSANRDGWLYTQQHSGDHKPTDRRSRQRNCRPTLL